MGRTSFDFDVISGPAPSRTQAPQPAPAKPAPGGDGASATSQSPDAPPPPNSPLPAHAHDGLACPRLTNRQGRQGVALHFERAEYDRRLGAAGRALIARGLDGLLMFQQESMYYLTGYDTFGFCFFQCLYLGADGRLALLTRSADLRQAQHTSLIEDIRIWTDAQGADPAMQLRDMLESLARAANGWGSKPTPMA